MGHDHQRHEMLAGDARQDPKRIAKMASMLEADPLAGIVPLIAAEPAALTSSSPTSAATASASPHAFRARSLTLATAIGERYEASTLIFSSK